MSTILQEPERLPDAVLKTLHQFEIINTRAPDFKVYRIVETSINKNYKLVQGHNALLLKLVANEIDLPIDRKKIFTTQEELAIIGLAPRPIFLNESQNIYCEEWLEFEKVHQHEQIEALAESLHTLHGAFVAAPKLPLIDHWQA